MASVLQTAEGATNPKPGDDRARLGREEYVGRDLEGVCSLGIELKYLRTRLAEL